MGVLYDEPPGRQSLNDAAEIRFGSVSILACTRDAVENPRSISVSLKPPDATEPGVGQRAIVEIHGILCRNDNPYAKSTRLLHQGHDRALGGRIRRMWQQE